MVASFSGFLPIPRTRLIGRMDECRTACTLLLDEAVPLLTLTGPGGVGKTRLALAIAAKVEQAFADGVVWVDLAPLADPALVPSAVANALSVKPAIGDPLEHELARVLRPRQILLLIDNCEHLIRAVATLVSGLLRTCAGLQVLATSRAPLRVRGECDLPVEPLPIPSVNSPMDHSTLATNEAISLFLERARGAGAAVEINTAAIAAVAEICRAVDGLPLAIELAAARTRVHTPEALRTELGNRLRILRDGARDAPPRQQTMRDAIGWSYDLLEPEAAMLFRSLGVFAGGFDPESAAAVSGLGAASVVEPLDVLLDQSLVRRERQSGGQARFGMLETVREYALDMLESSPDFEKVSRRHAAYFTSVAGRADMLRDPFSQEWGTQIEGDHGNVRAALRWLAANDPPGFVHFAGMVGWFWYYHGDLVEGRNWLDQAVAISERSGSSIPIVDRVNVEIACALICQMQGELDRSIALYRRAASVAENGDDFFLRAAARGMLGGALVGNGQYEEAAPFFEGPLVEWQAREHRFWAGYIQFHRGLLAFARGDLDVALRHFDDGRLLEEAHGGEVEAADVLHYLALIACERQDIETAAEIVLDILHRLTLRGSGPSLANGFADAALVASIRGHQRFAARLFGAAAELLHVGGGTYSLPAREVYERGQARAMQAVGELVWEYEFRLGRRMPLDRVLVETESMLISTVTGTSFTESSDEGARLDDGMDAASPRLSGHQTPDDAREFDLTRREREILVLLCQRLTDAEIAARLFISPRTASSHVSNVLDKLGAANRREAAGIAVRMQLV